MSYADGEILARLVAAESQADALTVECLNKDLRLVAAQKVIEAARKVEDAFAHMSLATHGERPVYGEVPLTSYDTLAHAMTVQQDALAALSPKEDTR